MNTLLANGRIVDGTGTREYDADLLIVDRRIAAIDRAIHNDDAMRIDCTGLVIAPGFIDAHSHSDVKVFENRLDKVRQGVTTEIVGNCGFSAFPCGHTCSSLREYANGIFCGSNSWGWRSASEYLKEIEEQSRAANVFALTGHGSLRVALAGMRQGVLADAELEQIAGLLEDSLSGGSIGFSTGLMYAPGSSAAFDELRQLCSVAAKHDATYCTHMRSYSWDLLEAIEEQIRLAEEAGCRLQLSHLQAVGRANWPKQEKAFELIDRARKSGVDIEFDSYPYLAGSTMLHQLLPQSALDGGLPAMVNRLTNAQARRDIARETEARMAQTWDDIMITGVTSQRNELVVGLTVNEIALNRGVEPIEAALDLLVEAEGDVKMISFNQSEENLRTLLTHPLCTVISDGFYVKGRPHPRLFGTFPELLGKYCRDKKWLPLEEAVHKVTGKPAQRFRLKDRGILRPGAHADVTVFDPGTVNTPATYSNPEQPPIGITLVLREGQELFRQATAG
jgi:dihydroorotase/N-acyl-D-amino-acid deacylase